MWISTNTLTKVSSSTSAGKVCLRLIQNIERILAAVCLRRESPKVSPILRSSAITYRPSFSEVERRVHDELVQACNRQLGTAANIQSTSEQGNLRTATFRLRRFCNTGMSAFFEGGLNDYDCDTQRLSSDEAVTLPQRDGENIRSIYGF